MRGLGIHVAQQKNILIDDEVRPHKNPRAACLRVKPPDDVRLLLSPIGGAYDYRTLFHEAGHAQHLAWSSRELAARHPEFIYAPDYATTEGYAFLFQHLFLDRLWLKEHRGNLNAEQTSDAVRSLALRTALTVRRYCAKLKYEIKLYDAPQVRSESLAATYSELQREATGFRRSPALYLIDVDDEFYVAAYLRAWAFEAGLREHLRTRHGRRWWASRKAGDELIDLWNTSSRYTVEELAQLIGFGEISFDLLADTFIAALQED
jgi:oligoendopeptidase F